jgi:hypothetical protein
LQVRGSNPAGVGKLISEKISKNLNTNKKKCSYFLPPKLCDFLENNILMQNYESIQQAAL